MVAHIISLFITRRRLCSPYHAVRIPNWWSYFGAQKKNQVPNNYATERISTIFNNRKDWFQPFFCCKKMNDSKQKFLSIFGGILFVREFNNDTATNEWTLQRHIVDAKANIGEHQLKLVLSPILLQVSRDSNCLAGYFCPTVPWTVTQTGFVESWFTLPGIQWPTWCISKWISSDVRNEEHSNSKSITKETKHGGLKRVTFPPLLLHFLVKMLAYMFSAFLSHLHPPWSYHPEVSNMLKVSLKFNSSCEKCLQQFP